MATKININTKQLHADIKALKDDIDASMRERLVIQCGYEELASQWSGPAAKTYDEGFRNAMTNMKALYIDLKDKIDGVYDMCKLFEKCEASVLDRIQEL